MNIYVSNLSFSTGSQSLQELFAEYGEVTSSRIITDRETGKSRGFGFIEMSDESEGENAISELHDTEFEGKTINVNIARPRVERSNSGYNNSGYNRGGNNGYNRGRY
ncbi:MAG: RNA-binding protein [Bacteroides sp.]|nr:RNA-binding protein [Bacteroides sp.]